MRRQPRQELFLGLTRVLLGPAQESLARFPRKSHIHSVQYINDRTALMGEFWPHANLWLCESYEVHWSCTQVQKRRHLVFQLSMLSWARTYHTLSIDFNCVDILKPSDLLIGFLWLVRSERKMLRRKTFKTNKPGTFDHTFHYFFQTQCGVEENEKINAIKHWLM